MTPDRFKLPPEIQEALAALPGERHPSYIERLESASSKGLPELLLISRRRVMDPDIKRRIDEIVGLRLGDVVRARARWHAIATGIEEPDDFASEVVSAFWREISEESFAESRFNLTVRTLIRDAAADHRRRTQRQPERPTERSLPGITYPEPSADVDETEAADARILVHPALDALSKQQARAIALRFYEGLPVFSQDPGDRTVASVLGRSQSHTHRLIRQGLDVLRSRMRLGTDDDE